MLLALALAGATESAVASSAQPPRLSDAVAEAGNPPAAQQPVVVHHEFEFPVADESYAEDVDTVVDLTHAFLELASAVWLPAPETAEADPTEGRADDGVPRRARPVASFTLGGRAGRLGGDELDGMLVRSIGLGVGASGQARLKLALYFARADLADEPRVADGIRSASEFGGDVALLMDLAPAQAAVGAQILMGMRLGRFTWKYRHPVEVIDGDTWESNFLYDDEVLAVSPYAGLGVEVLRAGRMHLTLMAIVGARTYGESTGEGFANDFFETANFTELGIELGLFPEAR